MRSAMFFALVALLAVSHAEAQDERTKRLVEDREHFSTSADWYYNDLDKGFDEAKRTGKPLLVVLRCVPCEACKVFDEQVAHDDPKIRALLDQFICVRVIKTNGLDLTLFQSDFDQSFAVFLLAADRTILGRYGTRPESESQESEMSLDGFAETLREGLALHKDFAANRAQLFRKTPPPQAYDIPEAMPELERFKEFSQVKNLEVRMCIHCHMVREAERMAVWNQGKPLSESMLFPWPSTRAAGFALDPRTANAVSEVLENSPAADAGLQAGDRLQEIDGQPIISLADAKWALHHAPQPSKITMQVERFGKKIPLELSLPSDWRTKTDISSRATTWDLRRIATGGLVLESLPADAKSQLGIAANDMALRVKYVGQYGEHAAGKNAGFREGDVIVEYNGRTDLLRETDAIADTVLHHKRGDTIAASVLRDGERLALTLPVQ